MCIYTQHTWLGTNMGKSLLCLAIPENYPQSSHTYIISCLESGVNIYIHLCIRNQHAESIYRNSQSDTQQSLVHKKHVNHCNTHSTEKGNTTQKQRRKTFWPEKGLKSCPTHFSIQTYNAEKFQQQSTYSTPRTQMC